MWECKGTTSSGIGNRLNTDSEKINLLLREHAFKISVDIIKKETLITTSCVCFHILAAKWNHIEDLDNFFTRVYHYHQRHGFTCMALQEVLELFQFIFVVTFSIFLLNCVDYPVLFK